MFKKSVEFIFYSSIFISLCAIAMCVETSLLMHVPPDKPGFYFFIFGGVMVQYNLHYLIKKTSHANSSHFEWSKKNRNTHFFLIGFGILLVLTGAFSFKLPHLIFLLILGAITLLYSLPVLPFAHKKRLKDYGLLKITTLVMLWTIITVLLPLAQKAYQIESVILVFSARFIFLFALCLLFDVRDAEIDARENIRTVPIITGVKNTYIIIHILLSVFVLLAFIGYLRLPETGHFNAMLLSAGATVFMISHLKKNKSDMAYLACIDGMMLLQAMLVIIGSI